MAMAANLYLLTPGSPFIYYGEEIGLRGSRGGADTDANRRLHMPWGDGDTVRDPEGSSYDSQTRDTVRSQLEQPGSLLRHYQKLLRLRKEFPEIARGTYKALNFEDTKMGGFLCELDGRTAAVFHNTSKGPLTVNLRDAGVSGMESAAVLETAESGNGAVLEDGILTLEGMTSVILR